MLDQNNTSYIATAATLKDSTQIAALLLHYSKMGNLLPRTKEDVEKHINNFYIIRDVNSDSNINPNKINTDEEKSIIACGALEHFSDELAEIRSLVVNPEQHGKGLGRILVERLSELAKERKVSRLMALTYSVGFFEKLNFHVVDKSIFPEKIWGVCINCYKFKNCDETAVLLNL